MQKQRIWELDALRGLCILCVIVVHFLFDLQFFIGLDFTLPAWFQFIQQYGGIFFVVLSGCCATLGSRSFRRGLIVFGAGMLISPPGCTGSAFPTGRSSSGSVCCICSASA